MSFFTAIILLLVAFFPSVVSLAHEDLRAHMVQHLLIAMYAPIFLILGAPVMLALKSLPVKYARKITSLIRNRFFSTLSHPVVALILNIGGMYFLYLTPLYNIMLSSPIIHYLVHIHFFAAGCLFTWAMIGPEHVPNRPGLRLRLTVLFFSLAAHAILSKMMFAYLLPRDTPHPTYQLQEGAKIMYYWGDLSELIIVVALFSIWYRNREKHKKNLSPLIP